MSIYIENSSRIHYLSTITKTLGELLLSEGPFHLITADKNDLTELAMIVESLAHTDSETGDLEQQLNQMKRLIVQCRKVNKKKMTR